MAEHAGTGSYVAGAQEDPYAATEQAAPLAGVCIMREGQTTSLGLDTSMLQQQGLKTRPSASCVPDLIITTPSLPAPLAIMVAQTSQAPDSMDSAFMDRCSSMANTFRLCCLFVPYTLAAHPAVLQVACACRFKGKITLQHYVPQDGLTHSILQFIDAQVQSSEGQQLELAEQQLAAATSAEALSKCLAAIASTDQCMPGPDHLQAMVGVCGSLQQLAGAAAEDVMGCTGCTEEQAQRLWWLFNGIES